MKLPRSSESEYKQSFAGKEEKIVWYKFRRALPQVTPPRTQSSNKPLRAQAKSRQSIVASAPNAPKRPRMVWSPAPEIRPVVPLESPNVVAVKLPAPAKMFAPPSPKAPQERAIRTAPAPELAASMRAPETPQAALAPKPFTAPARKPEIRRDARITTSDAPAIAATIAPHSANLNVQLAARPFTAPPKAANPAPAHSATLSDAPALVSSSPQAAPHISTELAPKPFTAPPSHAGQQRSASIATEPAPPALEANAANLNLAVVGLNPLDRPLPPPSSSPADFSAGKQLRTRGADSQSSNGGLAVPGLFVGPAYEKSNPDLIAQAFDAPTSPASIQAAAHSGVPLPSSASAGHENEATSHSGAVRVANAPEPRFAGRDVFMMAIQMPNLTSYSGSWLMWYADRTRRETGLAPVAPPVPHRKVDPKYVASAVSDRVEGKVRLACVITKAGTVGGVELLRGLDERLNQSAEEALGKWEFYPAMRNGEPVDVDVVVEIPFRLEPLAPRR